MKAMALLFVAVGATAACAVSRIPRLRRRPRPVANCFRRRRPNHVDFVKAEIPSRTRDGREWDSLGGSLPDPFAKLS
jgi:hypothetical protein